MRLIIARHGATEWNQAERLQGNIDIPLSLVGQAEAQALAEQLAHFPIDYIYASGLQRTQATAAPLAQRLQQSVVIDARLNEFDWGIFKGIPRPERDQHPVLGPLWLEVQQNIRTTSQHQGELFIDFEQRIQMVLNDLVQKHSDQTVAIISHGAVKRMMLSLMGGLPYEEMRVQQWQTGSYTVVRHEAGQFVIEQLHVTDHLL